MVPQYGLNVGHSAVVTSEVNVDWGQRVPQASDSNEEEVLVASV